MGVPYFLGVFFGTGYFNTQQFSIWLSEPDLIHIARRKPVECIISLLYRFRLQGYAPD